MSFFETVEAQFKDWHYDHPRILYSLIRSLRPRVCVEVGTYRGYAACYMARALQENNSGHLFCIDNFSLTDFVAKYGDPKKHWAENLQACGVYSWATLLQGDSDKVDWPEHVDFAYIDGWHSYDAARHDFNQCAQRGAQCICLDDTINCAGPRLLMNEMKAVSSTWSVLDIPSDNGLSICMRKQKVRDVTFSQELPNHPGVDVSVLSREDRIKHFREAYQYTGVDYMELGIGLPS